MDNTRETDWVVKLLLDSMGLHPEAFRNNSSPIWIDNILLICAAYEHTGQRIRHDNSILLQQSVLNLLSSDHHYRPNTSLKLGSSLLKRYERWSEKHDLDESVFVFRTALELLPERHPTQSALQASLGVAITALCQYTGSEKLLDEAISLYDSALTLCAPDSTHRAFLLSNYVIALLERFDRKGREGDLERAFSLIQEALNLLPNSHPNRNVLLSNHSIVSYFRFRNTGSIKDLDDAIIAYRSTLNLAIHAKSRSKCFKSLTCLAGLLHARFQETGQSDDLNEAIFCNCKALFLFPKVYADCFTCSAFLNNFADSLYTRYEQSGSEKDLDNAIIFYCDALALYPKDHIDWPLLANNLARCLTGRFGRRGWVKDADDAISLNRDALKVRLERNDQSGYLLSLDNLAGSLLSRFEEYGKTEDLDEVMTNWRLASTFIPKDNPERSVPLNSMAYCLRIRFEQTGRIEDLDESISIFRESFALYRESHVDYSLCLGNFALSLLARHEQTKRNADLEEAISLYRRALVLCVEGHVDRAWILNNLGMALKMRFVQSKQLEDIEEAILHHRAALKLRPYGHTKRCISLSHLAAALYDYFWCFREDGQQEGPLLVVLDEAVSFLEEAVSLEPVGQPQRPDTLNRLARCFLSRFKSLGQKDDLNKATSRVRNALDLCPEDHPHRSELLRTLAESLRTRFEMEHGEGNLEKSMNLFKRAATHKFSGTLSRLHAAHHWATAAHTNDHHSALRAYQEATSLLQHALTISPTMEMQHEFLTTNYTNGMLVLNAAAYAIKIGELGKAVEFLEQGRALLWAQMRSFRSPLDKLAEVDQPLAENFADVSRRLETLATVSPTRSPGLEETIVKTESDHVPKAQRLVDEMLKLRRQLSLEQEKLINKIRQLPGFDDFLRATPFKTLKQAANEGPVIIINCSVVRSDALIILPRDDPPIVCVPLEDSFREKAMRLYKDLVGTRQKCGASSPEYNEVLRQVLQALWDLIVSKIVKKLKELGFGEGTRIWWCTTSILSALPFHAAGPFEGPDGGKKYLVDEYVSSYTPTLTALIDARSVRRKGKTKLLVIGDTSLASAWEEIETIRKYRMRTKELIANEATRDAVIESLRDTKWVHFTCHGHLDPNPLESSFKLHDGRLSLLDIVKAHLPNAEFAFLSACHTAEQHYKGAQDEVLHLSAAMQFCGFRSVIGSMWELYDPDGPRFAKVIYQYMNMGPKGEVKYKRAAGALREAVLKLKERRDATTENWVNLIHIGA